MSGQSTSTLGIVAGGGDLPIAIAQSVRTAGRSVFLAALVGSADKTVEAYPHAWIGLGEIGKMIRSLRDAGCGEVLMAGKLLRPKFSDIKLDAKGMMIIPQVIAAARRGDNAILDAIAALFAAEGFPVIGVAEAAPALLAPNGKIGRLSPTKDERVDIDKAFAIVRALGTLDVGQAAVVCEGLPLAVEAAEGTDAMLSRIPHLPAHFHGTDQQRRGVLVKAIKPIQDGKTDLPVIGLKTLEMAAAAGLAGIAVEAGRALILNREAVAETADRLGLFVTGIAPGGRQ